MTEAPRRPPVQQLSRSRRRAQAIRYVGALDGIRALAALGVVIIHTQSEAGASMRTYAITGMVAGPLFMSFFTITGFVLYRGWARRHLAMHDADGTPGAGAPDGGSDGRRGRFLLRRLIRIYPLYWIVATAAMLVNQGSTGRDYTILDRLQVFLLSPLPRVENLIELGLGLVVWTLVIDIAFYLYVTVHGAVMTAVVRRLPRVSPFRIELYVLVPMAVAPILLAPFVRGPLPVLSCLPLGMGFAVFEAQHDRIRRRLVLVSALVSAWRVWLALALVIGPAFVWSLSDVADYDDLILDMWPIPVLLVLASAAIIIMVLWGPRRWAINRFFASDGMKEAAKYTYGLYLWHPVVHMLIRRHRPESDLLEYELITITASLALAFITFHLVEKPLGRTRQRLRAPAPVGDATSP